MGGKVGIVLHLARWCGVGQSQQPGRSTRAGNKMRLCKGHTTAVAQSDWVRCDTSSIIGQFVFIPAPCPFPLILSPSPMAFNGPWLFFGRVSLSFGCRWVGFSRKT